MIKVGDKIRLLDDKRTANGHDLTFASAGTVLVVVESKLSDSDFWAAASEDVDAPWWRLSRAALGKDYDFVKPESSVNHPKHYNQGKIEVIEFIEDQGMGEAFCLGNAIKYIARAGKKHPGTFIEDLEKARWYLDRIIEVAKARREEREPLRPNEMNPR